MSTNSRRTSPALVLALLVSFASACSVAGGLPAPNLVFVLTDDQARWAMGAYGNTELQTPNMDRIAREGALFTNAFVATPVCSPSRATFLSGLYPTQHTVRDALDPNMDYTRMGFRSPTWSSVLRQHGYRTALFGKWHLGEYPAFSPFSRGFEHFFGWVDEKPANIDPVFMIDSPESDLPRWAWPEEGGFERKFEGALVDVLTEQTIRFIDAHRDEPFAVFLHHLAPHKPYLPVLDEDMAPYRNLVPATPPDLPGHVPPDWFISETRAYYASVSSVDRSLGRLLDHLDSTGLADNTIVIFTSDHGYSLGRHGIETKGNGPLVAKDLDQGPRIPNMHDNSLRIPLAIRWPASVAPGTVVDGFLSNIDLYPTCLGLLGLPVPDDFRGQGVDFSGALRGDRPPERDAIFGQYDINAGTTNYMRMIRTPRWKYVRYFRTYFKDQLFDLERDPYELDNLLERSGPRPGGIPPVEFTLLQERLLGWMRSIDDPLLTDTYW